MMAKDIHFETEEEAFKALKTGRLPVEIPVYIKLDRAPKEFWELIREAAKDEKFADWFYEWLAEESGRKDFESELHSIAKDERRHLEILKSIFASVAPSGESYAQGVGRAVGGAAASLGLTAIGAPELIPFVAPVGAAVGGEAEKAVRGAAKEAPKAIGGVGAAAGRALGFKSEYGRCYSELVGALESGDYGAMIDRPTILDAAMGEYGAAFMPGAAEKAECNCVEIPEKKPGAGAKLLCTRPGAVGILSQQQVRTSCSETKMMSNGRLARVEKLREAQVICNDQVKGEEDRGTKFAKRFECLRSMLTE